MANPNNPPICNNRLRACHMWTHTTCSRVYRNDEGRINHQGCSYESRYHTAPPAPTTAHPVCSSHLLTHHSLVLMLRNMVMAHLKAIAMDNQDGILDFISGDIAASQFLPGKSPQDNPSGAPYKSCNTQPTHYLQRWALRETYLWTGEASNVKVFSRDQRCTNSRQFVRWIPRTSAYRGKAAPTEAQGYNLTCAPNTQSDSI